ncbi:MAG: Arginase [Candidatus Saccharibacteria bacterium]|nr:Arginase [Candidatus Saccharibacteria bacterium]
MNQTPSNDVTLIGIPLDLGAESLGVDIGPSAFRKRKIVEKFQHAGLSVEDMGDLPCTDRSQLEPGDPLKPYAAEIVRINEQAAKMVDESIKNGKRPVIIGGDHSINLGAFSGAAAAVGGTDQIGLIYLDAHGDMNTPDVSISHNIHGMHVASLMGFGGDELIDVYGQGAKLKKENLLHAGGSDFDQAEIDLIARENLACFTMFDFLKDGLAPLIAMIDDLQKRVPNIWVSLDLDCIDVTYAPGVGIPSRGGYTYREIAAITEYIGKNCNVVGIDVVEYNPVNDDEGKTADLGIELATKLLGTNYSWYTNYMDRNSETGTYAQTQS